MEVKGHGIGLHRDDSYAAFEARSLTIEADNNASGQWQMRQFYPAMNWVPEQNDKAPVHEFSVPSGTVTAFNCKNPHAAEPNPGRWSINLWSVSPKHEAAYQAHLAQHGLDGGAASKIPAAKELQLPAPILLTPSVRAQLPAPTVIAVTDFATFSRSHAAQNNRNSAQSPAFTRSDQSTQPPASAVAQPLVIMPSAPKPYNPVSRVQPINERVAKHQLKDIAMAEVATQFIGRSATPEAVPSSTRAYMQEWAKIGRANTGSYANSDVVMVSGSGPWRRAGDPRSDDQIRSDIRQTFANQVVPLLDKAIAANAQIVVGDANGTDKLVQQHLREQGYRLSAENGFYRLTPERTLINEGVIQPVGKPVQMVYPLKMHGDANPLPVDTCIEAMRGYGRCHTTRNFEPHKAYGFAEGDIAVAYARNQQVAFRVGEQYRITPEMLADPAYQQQWAAMEKHSSQELQSFQGKPTVWGLRIEPLGDYVNGKIEPFPPALPLRCAEMTSGHQGYDSESLVSHHTGTGEAIASPPEQALYNPSRSELLEWLSVAKVICTPEHQMAIRTLGLELKEQYNLDQGSSGASPPMDYRHASVVVTEQDYRQMQQAVSTLRDTIVQMQPAAKPAVMHEIG